MSPVPTQLSTAVAAEPEYQVTPYKWVAGYVGLQDGFMCQGKGIISFGYTEEQAYAAWKKKQPTNEVDIPVVSNYRSGLEPPTEG